MERGFKKKEAKSAIRIVRDLFKIIDRVKISYCALERKSGANRVTFARWRNGTRSPNLQQFEAAAQVLGYRVILWPIEQPLPSLMALDGSKLADASTDDMTKG